jgi:hypothetical protein
MDGLSALTAYFFPVIPPHVGGFSLKKQQFLDVAIVKATPRESGKS